MTTKTRTRVVIETHEQTIIRGSSNKITAQTVPTGQPKRNSLGQGWKALVVKGATVLEPLSRRLKRRDQKPK
jgi:hypothetical protein